MGFENWKTNFSLIRRDFSGCSGCSLHSGFYGAYNGMAKSVANAFTSLRQKYPNKKLWITGHSLGGALATVCASEIYEQFKVKPDTFITFGSPRVGKIIKLKFSKLQKITTIFKNISI